MGNVLQHVWPVESVFRQLVDFIRGVPSPRVTLCTQLNAVSVVAQVVDLIYVVVL